MFLKTLVWKRLSNEYKIKLKVLQWVESNRKPILFEKLASGFGKLGRVCFDQNLISCEVLREGNGQLQGLVAGWGGCEGRGGRRRRRRRRGCWILLEDSSTNNMCVSLFHGFPRTWQWLMADYDNGQALIHHNCHWFRDRRVQTSQVPQPTCFCNFGLSSQARTLSSSKMLLCSFFSVALWLAHHLHHQWPDLCLNALSTFPLSSLMWFLQSGYIAFLAETLARNLGSPMSSLWLSSPRPSSLEPDHQRDLVHVYKFVNPSVVAFSL